MKIISRTIEAMTLPFTISFAVQDSVKAYPILDNISEQMAKSLERLEHKFSSFREDSLVSRFRQGDLSVMRDKEFQEVYTRTIAAQKESMGYFNPYFDGKFNPTGFVKGWVISKLFKDLLFPLFRYPFIEAICLNGGGDMQFDTRLGSSFVWEVGIENPDCHENLIAKYSLAKGAVATSGFSKRGRHIKQINSFIKQVTVVGSDLSIADVWATTLLACPENEIRELIATHKLSGLYVRKTKVYYYQHGEFYDIKKSSV